MQVLPGKHAAEMPMVSPKGHCKAAVGLSPRQHASCPHLAGVPRSQCPQGCWERDPGPWRIYVLCNKTCIVSLEEQNQWNVYTL